MYFLCCKISNTIVNCDDHKNFYLFVVGVWIHESGVLGASPDGLVVTPIDVARVHLQQQENCDMAPEIVEVKCPFSARDMTVRQAAERVKGFPLGDHNSKMFT